ncbi:MAG: hypothetical protein ACJAX9_002083 [Celeribacter sp.]|jgi:hypothetical protein
MQPYDWVNATARKEAQIHDIHAACHRLWLAWIMLVLTCLILSAWSVFLLA